MLVSIGKIIAQPNLQNQYKQWHIGYNAGVNFNTTPNLIINSSALTTLDYSASISDTNGALLFYTNGSTIWNSANTIMQNGTGLNGDISGGQTALIIKKPNDVDEVSRLYYVFNVTYYATDGLYYSIVDMSLNNGLGAVIQKNVLINPLSTEKLAAVYNSEKGYYWIITHNWNSDVFSCYKLKTSGIVTNPVISNAGLIITQGTFGSSHDAMGQISVSPDGEKIACAYNYSGKYEFYNFDINTGIVSNAQSVSGYPSSWGIEFSEDSKKVYATQWTYSTITQFDITNFNASSIQASAGIVGNVNCSDPLYKAGYLELAPDGKIYIAKFGENYLATISNTNQTVLNCIFNDLGQYLGNGTSKAGLSNSPVFPFTNNSNSIDETPPNAINIYPNPTSTFINIDFDDPEDISKITLSDVLGNVISEISTDIKTSNSLNIDKLSNGTYFCIVLFKSNKTHSKKLVLIH